VVVLHQFNDVRKALQGDLVLKKSTLREDTACVVIPICAVKVLSSSLDVTDNSNGTLDAVVGVPEDDVAIERVRHAVGESDAVVRTIEAEVVLRHHEVQAHTECRPDLAERQGPIWGFQV
jgi:hypothetical protein